MFSQWSAEELSESCRPQERLRGLGSHYGALPVHEGLWESARATAHSLPARLAVESCVHEARGLDVLPQTIARFRAGGDAATADLLLSTVYPVSGYSGPFASWHRMRPA